MAAVYTFADLQNQVLAYLDETGSTGTSLTLTKQLINQAQQMRLAMLPWKFLEWDSAETFTTVAGQRFYPLHQEFWRPIYFFNRATSDYLIEVPNRQLADTKVRWNTDSGHALYFRLTSRSPVAVQPTSPSVLELVSNSGSDNSAAKAITVKGVTANGVTSETVTPNGTTPVATIHTYSKILAVTKTVAWSGNLTLSSNSGAVTNLFLFPTEYGRSYQQLELLTNPTPEDVIEYRFLRMPNILVNDYDVPELPFPHAQILVWDTLLLFAGYLTDISQKSIDAWKDIVRKMEIQLAEAFKEGQGIEANPRYVRYLGEADATGPLLFLS